MYEQVLDGLDCSSQEIANGSRRNSVEPSGYLLPVTVRGNAYFVMGDNQESSLDSRLLIGFIVNIP